MIGDLLLCALFITLGALGALGAWVFCSADRRDLSCPCGRRRLQNVVITDPPAERSITQWLMQTCPDCSRSLSGHSRFQRNGSASSSATSRPGVSFSEKDGSDV